MTNDTLIQEVNYLIEQCIASENKPNAARRLLAASNLLSSELELLRSLGDRSRMKTLLTLATRLVLRAGELLGDDSEQYRMLEAEADVMTAAVRELNPTGKDGQVAA